MKTKRFALLRAAAVLLTAALAAGCVVTIPTNPDLYPAKVDDFPALPAGTTVEITNGFSSTYFAEMDGRQQADLQEFTQTAVVVLGRSLEKRGATITSGAAGGRTIVLEVTGPAWTQGFGFVRGSVSLNAEFGGTKVSTWGEAAGIQATKNFSSAITHAVEALMQKQEFRDFLLGPETP